MHAFIEALYIKSRGQVKQRLTKSSTNNIKASTGGILVEVDHISKKKNNWWTAVARYGASTDGKL